MNYFVVNSKNRISLDDSTHSFSIKLNKTIDITKCVQLKYISIPFDEYLINDYSNIIKIDSTEIELTKGNYDVDDLVTHINTKFQVGFPNLVLSYNASTL